MSILKKLQEKSIFKIETADEYFGNTGRFTEQEMSRWTVIDKEEQKKLWRNCEFVITEGCDGYFSFPLTKKELIELSNEIKAIAETKNKQKDVFDEDIFGI